VFWRNGGVAFHGRLELDPHGLWLHGGERGHELRVEVPYDEIISVERDRHDRIWPLPGTSPRHPRLTMRGERAPRASETRHHALTERDHRPTEVIGGSGGRTLAQASVLRPAFVKHR
jgi:hypothetical protein